MDLIQISVGSAPPDLRPHLEIMAGLDNVPRKEKQFRNFTTNSLNLRGRQNAETVVSNIWNHLKSLREKQLAERAADEERKKAEKTAIVSSDEKMNKRDSSKKEAKKSSAKKSEKPPSAKPDKKSVKKAMKSSLKKAKDRTLSLKDLRKAVKKKLSLPESSDSGLKELVKTCSLKKNTFVVDGKKVSLKVS